MALCMHKIPNGRKLTCAPLAQQQRLCQMVQPASLQVHHGLPWLHHQWPRHLQHPTWPSGLCFQLAAAVLVFLPVSSPMICSPPAASSNLLRDYLKPNADQTAYTDCPDLVWLADINIMQHE